MVDNDFDAMTQHLAHAAAGEAHSINPQRYMLRAVIFQAFVDLSVSYPGRHKNLEPYHDAINWFFSSDRQTRADFNRICDAADLDKPTILRRAARVMHLGMKQRADSGTAKNYDKRRERYLKSKFSSAAPGISGGGEFQL